jgi:hypothetical protein
MEKRIPLISEFDVQIGTIKWLVEHNWKIEKISPPTKQGFDVKRKLNEELTNLGINTSIRYSNKGEDILATKDGTNWKIECKGLSSGEDETIDENFERAIASVVLYYTQKERLQLGLAMPEYYLEDLRNKLPKTLREALKLWLFIYSAGDQKIFDIWSPEDELP